MTHTDPSPIDPSISTGRRLGEVTTALELFYADVIHALAEHCRSPRATAQGAPRIVQRVAREWGLHGARTIPLPRLTRIAYNRAAVPPSRQALGRPRPRP